MAIFSGTSLPDKLYGTGGSDLILGLDGNDKLYGGGGNDLLYGNKGDDLLEGGSGNDLLEGGVGNDFLEGGAGADKLFGDSGRDVVFYDESGAGVTVNLASNTASGGDAAGDTFDSIEGLSGSKFADFLIGDAHANSLNGWLGDDFLFGGDGNDHLEGGEGADRLVGGNNDDYLAGEGGADLLWGGTGADHFVFASTGASQPGDGHRDTIYDFSHAQGDKIDLHAIDAVPSMTLNQDFSFVGQTQFYDSGQVRFSFVGNDTLVQVNTTGSAGAEMEALLKGHVALAEGDFIL